MTLYEFNQLHKEDKLRALGAQGIFLVHESDTRGHDFYWLDEFYVRVHMDQGTGEVRNIVAFTKGDLYEQLVSAISLDMVE